MMDKAVDRPARPRVAVALGLLALSGPAVALERGSPCDIAIAAQEGRAGLPPGLLRAIARVESGGNPWAFNGAGTSGYGSNREDAVARVRALHARGIRSVDVGCMQINLQHHPHAFRTLEDAFEPAQNVTYAVRFLGELHQRHGSWPAAIAHYHSATPERGGDYLRRVNLAWSEAAAVAAARPAPNADRVTVLISPAALQVQVIRPSSAMAPMRARVAVSGQHNLR